MPKVSVKNQVTLPVAAMRAADIKNGDEVEMFVFEGNITLVSKKKAAGKGVLSHIKANKSISDNDSLQTTVTNRRKAAK